MKLLSQKAISYIFTLIIVVFVIYYLVNNWESVKSISWWERPGYLSIHMVLLFLTFALFVISWQRLLITIGNDVSIKVACYTWLTPNIGKYIPGKVFMIAGRIVLLNHFGVRKTTAVAATIWEHVILILTAMPFSLFILFDNSEKYSLKMVAMTVSVLTLILIVVLNPVIIQRLINLALSLFKKPPLDLPLKRKDILYLFIFYLMIWIVYGLTGITLAYAFGFEDNVSMLFLFNVYIFSWFIGFISMITPGGFGVREGVLILMISPYVPVAELMTYAFLARMTWMLTEIAGVIVGMVLSNKLNDVIDS